MLYKTVPNDLLRPGYEYQKLYLEIIYNFLQEGKALWAQKFQKDFC